MTPEEYNKKLSAFVKDIETKNIPLQRAVQSTFQLEAKRIFTDGIKSSGAKIGNYDTKNELYVNPDHFPGDTSGLRPPKGKNDDTHFKDGSAHKTTYVKNYKELRKKVGRQNAFVDLKLSGDLFSDFTNTNPNAATSQAKATKVNPNQYVVKLKREINQKKLEGMEDKYGEISNLTTTERTNLERVAILELINDLTKRGLA